MRYSLHNLPPGRTDWKRIERATDEEIEAAVRNDPDAGAPTDESFWKDARIVLPEPKEAISIRVDRSVLTWFKAQGRGYQTRMNAVLRAYVEAQGKR